MVSKILVASQNKHKLLELQTVAREFGLNLISPLEAQGQFGLNALPVVNETGATYRENATFKARAYARWSRLPSLGDDSGLEVTALGGRPGIHSARYAGEGASDKKRIEKLLNDLAYVEQQLGTINRQATFHCALVLAYPNGDELYAEGILSGEVLYESRGVNGFGYDPIVYIPEIGATLAEVDFSVTCDKGFRAVAARKLFDMVTR